MASLPTVDQLRAYVAEEECYLVAEQLCARWPSLTCHAGFYRRPGMTSGADHAWCQAADGTIIDTTHRQFVSARPIVIAAPGSRLHARYFSWERHHPDANPGFCLHRELAIPYHCAVAVDSPQLGRCDYLGVEDPHDAARQRARALADHADTGLRGA